MGKRNCTSLRPACVADPVCDTVSQFILLRAAIVLLFTLSTLFTEPTVGKAPAQRLEEGTGSHKSKYLMMSMHSAINDFRCYTVIIYKMWSKRA